MILNHFTKTAALTMGALFFSVNAFAAPPVANFSATVSPANAKPGQTVTVKILAAIQSPWHIYSVKPVPPPGPQATTFKFEAAGLTPVGQVTENAPVLVKDENFGKNVGMHAKTATFTQKFMVGKTAKNGKLPIKVEAFFMACNDKQCLPPRFVDVKPILLTVEGAK